MPKHETFDMPLNDVVFCEDHIKKGNISRREYQRYKILLLLNQDYTYSQIEEELSIVSHTISKWKSRYLEEGLAGLVDKQRPGRAKTITPEIEAKVLKLVQEPPPVGYSHWSAMELSRRTKIPKTTVRDILARNHLKPHLHRSYLPSNDPEFEEKATKIIGLYMNPPGNAVVLCVDEKTQIQALDRMQPNLPLKPHLIERQTFEYKRNGITNLYAAFNTKTGKVTGDCKKTHNQYDFMNFLDKLAKEYRNEKKVYVILDNISTHKTKDVRKWLAAHPNWQFCFTPTYSSWLNQVEIWFSIISRQCIRRGVFDSVKDLMAEIKSFINAYNKNSKPFEWKYDNLDKRITV